MNKIATIETIHSFSAHSNADSLELAKVLGFQVVVKKGQFSHGEKVVFVWPDTVCTPAEWNRFLDKKGDGKPIRIKSCKLRGQFSTGLVLPISTIEGFSGPFENGTEVALFLKIEKYVKDDGGQPDGQAAGAFPSHIIHKTDEDLAQSNPSALDEMHGKECYLSLKIDGQSLTLISLDGEITVCSRNLKIKEGESKFWNTVRKYNLIENVRAHNIAIQGEQYGVGIQGNPLGVSDIRLAVFNAKNLTDGNLLSMNELHVLCPSLGVDMVPVLDVFCF